MSVLNNNNNKKSKMMVAPHKAHTIFYLGSVSANNFFVSKRSAEAHSWVLTRSAAGSAGSGAGGQPEAAEVAHPYTYPQYP